MKALVLCLTDVAADPRPRRIVQTLRDLGWAVTASGPPEVGPRGIAQKARTAAGMVAARIVPGIRARVLGQRFDYPAFESQYRGPWDLIVVEDIYLLPLAFEIGAVRIVMDAREYYPRIGEQSAAFHTLQRPELTWICRRFLPCCDAVLTVSGGLADEYAREFGINAVVVRSVSEYADHAVNPTADDAVRMVHHGIANRNRRLDNLIDVVHRLDARFTLDFYLTPNHSDPGYLASLRERVAGDSRIRILDPVSFEQIGTMLNAYDVGLFYVEPSTFNLKHCLPNKLFEFIQARLAVAIGPSPDMAAIVNKHGCGVVAPAFTTQSMADILAALDAQGIDALKRNSDRAAHELCWSVERRVLERVLIPA